ncbi:MAG: response regulator [Bdellovibrionales bacterium]|nr:response regulator [Bdellovibrionales bacterium]
MRILIAEDNIVNQKVLRIILERYGADYEIAETGAIAVEKFASGSFDLVLMDCQMPQMDGLEASRKIRELETQQSRKRTPIVAMTANAMKGDRERCLSHGMDDFLAKPFKSNELISVVETWERQ